MVFYFESIPDDQRSKLAKQVGRLGAVSRHPLCPVSYVSFHAYRLPPPA
jgi:hypothetical protein